jgi:predicted GTPase
MSTSEQQYYSTIDGSLNAITNFAGGIYGVAMRVAENVTEHYVEQERLLSKPIDILCFGRSGVGKTTLLEALTGMDLGSTAKLDHGTTKLQCHLVDQYVPKKNGSNIHIHLRFWDTKGIDNWNSGDVTKLFEELKEMKVYFLF